MNSMVIALLVKSSVLIGLALAVNRLLLQRRSAASRHLVWSLALGGVLLLPLLSGAVPSWEIPVRVSAASSGPAPAAVAALPSSADAGMPHDVMPDDNQSASAMSGPVALSAVPRERNVSWPDVAIGIYAAGVLLLSLRLARDHWNLRKLVKDSAEVTDPSWRALLRECESCLGVSQPVRLLRSLDRNMPMAFGVLQPAILIPAIADTWPEDRRRAVLLHEVAHIERRDCLTQFLSSLTCAFYWMHPGVWWVASRLRVERELACDDRVLAAGTGARDYASHLLEIAYSLGSYRSPALVVSMARPRQLEGRMLAVLDAARNRVSPSPLAYAAGLVLTAALLLPLSAAEAVVIADSSEEPRMVSQAERVAAVSPEESKAEQAPMAPLAPLPPLPPQAGPESTSDHRRREIQLPGTWEVRSSNEANRVSLRLSDRPNSMHGFDIALDQLDGFSASLLTGSGGNAKFGLRREAGTLTFDGVFRSGVGAGTFDFTPNQAFPGEMTKRGFESPNAVEQYQLARGNIGLIYLDELTTQQYERPSLAQLVRAADHGVHLDYLRGMGAAGYRLGKLEALIRTRDHGVTPAYVRAMADEVFKNLTADQLVRARDHGVEARYIKVMSAFGYKDLPLDELIRARDHGVSEEYIRGMLSVWPEKMALAELIRTRDHGVTPEYMKAMREAGYGATSLEDLVRARDHGVGAEFVKGMLALGLVPPTLDEVVKARDHGVSPEFVKAFQALGYKPTLEEMVKARDHGVDAAFARSFGGLGYERLSIKELVRLRDHGVSADFVKKENETPRGKLSVEELVRRRSGR